MSMPPKLELKGIIKGFGDKRVLDGLDLAVETGKSLAKVGVVGVIVAMTLIPKMTQLAATVGISPAMLGSQLGSMALSVAQRAAIAPRESPE